MTKAEEQVARFRDGEILRKVPEGFIVAGKPDEAAVSTLEKALSEERDAVREPVVRLLVMLAQQTDPLYGAGGRLVRNRSIISVLAGAGIARQDAVRDYCLDALHTHVPADVLKEYGDSLASNLKRWPDSTALLAVAKAKPGSARPVVKELMRSPQWANEENTLIAGAALGDTALEKKFIQQFSAARDAAEAGRLAKVLGFIGTRPALVALASQMRTDLIFVLPGSFRRSVRLDIMAALSFNFPDKLFLYDNAVLDDKGYERVEKFCEESFEVRWKAQRPPFLTVEGFPIPPPR